MKKEKQTIDDVIAEFCEYLRSIERKECTIKAYVSGWQKVKEYMLLNQIVYFEKTIAEAYLKFRFGDFEYDQLLPKYKSLVNIVEALFEFQDTGKIFKTSRKPPKVYKGEIGQSMLRYMNFKRTAFNLAERTLVGYSIYLHGLMTYLSKLGIQCFESITKSHLISFICTLDENRLATKDVASDIIKGYLRYIYSLGHVDEDFSLCIPKVNYRERPGLPSTFTRAEISILLETIDRANPRGKRDYAILLMATKLGMRSSDIIGLKFENILWEQNRIEIIQQKTGKMTSFPLLPEIGNAIIDYLKYGRPASPGCYCFLQCQSPYTQMQRSDMGSLTKMNLIRAGINITNRKHGPHALRHAFAGQLLANKTPLPIISEALGHSQTQSTMFYLRIDITTLRQCAIEVPSLPVAFYYQKGGLLS